MTSISTEPSVEMELSKAMLNGQQEMQTMNDTPTRSSEINETKSSDGQNHDGVDNGINDEEGNRKRKCCSCFNGNIMARGVATVASGRGAIVMSNIFISNSLIYLASEAAGCFDDEGKVDTTNCTTPVYGFFPATLITNIAVISGVLSALFMPLIGAIVDFTPYRQQTGIASAVMLMLIQGVRIYTVSSTWFPMALLQALAGFIYQVQVLAAYAYLPELASDVGEKTMTNFSSKITMIQFGSQGSFLLLITILSIAISMSSVLTAQVSQAINCCWILVAFGYGWFRCLPKVGTRHESLPTGTSNLCSAGFAQLWRTAKSVNANYGRSLRWYYLALIFAESGVNSFTIVAVTFQTAQLQMSGSEIGIQFLLVLICTVPGAKIAELVTRRTNAKKSWMICLVVFGIVTAVASFILTGPSRKNASYFFIVLWGLLLGWFYPTENLLFSLLLPKGQESEMSGIYVYCSQIIGWLPPLIFSVMYESGINMKYGLLSLVIFMAIGVVLLGCMAPWEIALEEVARPAESNIDAIEKSQHSSSVGVDEEAGQSEDERVEASQP